MNNDHLKEIDFKCKILVKWKQSDSKIQQVTYLLKNWY